MTTSNLTFKGSFDIVGTKMSAIMNAAFTVTSQVQNPTITRFGYLESNDNDLTITGVFGNSGTITEKYGPYTQPVSNATIYVKQNQVIIDKVKTDANGNYTIFVEPGVYDIEINGQAYKRTIKNYNITQGITQVYSVINTGQIFQRFYDTISFVEYDSSNQDYTYYNNWLINGQILDDRNNTPVSNVDIVISTGNEVVVFVTTDENGQYSFMLPFGTYDVRFRIPNQHVKMIEGFQFGGRNGFYPAIAKSLI